MRTDSTSILSIKKMLRHWEESGLSRSAYCRNKNLSYHRFIYWQRRLSVSSDSKEGFLPVEVVASKPASSILVRGRNGIEVLLPVDDKSVSILRQLLA